MFTQLHLLLHLFSANTLKCDVIQIFSRQVFDVSGFVIVFGFTGFLC